MFRKSDKPSASAEDLMAEFLQKKKVEPKNQNSELETKFQALWQLLQKKLDLSENDLEAEISLIKEAKAKKKEVSPNAEKVNCPKCQRPVSIKTGICIYCGKE